MMAFPAARIALRGTSRHVRLAMIASRSNIAGHAIGSTSGAAQPPMNRGMLACGHQCGGSPARRNFVSRSL